MIPIVIVVPFSRPENAANVLANFARQTYPAKTLLIVENGRGLNAWRGPGTVLKAPQANTAGKAKNVALKYLRDNGVRWACIMDDDDYYSPGYLAEQAPFMSRYAIVGKNQHFILDDDGFWLVNAYVHSTPYHWCSGGVQCLDLNRVGWFTEGPLHEDVNLVHDAQKMGQTLFVTSPYGTLLNRTGQDHTFKQDIIERCLNWGMHVVRLGDKVDLALVDGVKRIGQV